MEGFRTAAVAATALLASFSAQAARRQPAAADQNDSVRALIRPGTTTRKVERANRATAIAFWRAIYLGKSGEDDSDLLAADFVNHAPGLAAGGKAFVDALRAREQAAPVKKPLFELGNGELVMIAIGDDARDPQAKFHVGVLRIKDGKISEYWESER